MGAPRLSILIRDSPTESAITQPQPPPDGDIDIGWKLEVQALLATIIDFVATDHGLGRHTYLTYEQAVNQQYYSLLAQVFCVNALSFAKLSIVVSYIRVLRGSGNRLHRVLLWTVGISVLVVNTVVIITFYVACNLTEKSWDLLTPGTCWTMNTRLAFPLLQGAESSNFAKPPLQLRNGTKVLVFGLVDLGTLTGVFAMTRIVETGPQLHIPAAPGPDMSFSIVLGLMWSGMERNIAIIIRSIPALNPLVGLATRLVKQTLDSSILRLRSVRSHSHQPSDIPPSQKLPDDDSRRRNHVTRGNPKTGAATSNTSEGYILPKQSLERE
ncbi:hypothetical protein GGS23DRAFT_619745 [Durotheca rogersii]|uniref:uncharacterized protein n=1 Tax=Durotheca rogersii TaxID=419775 RepID=UPI00221FFD5D|nr:uncharacterized protein GGS23DRAFT_619745 [Durotheca rogersii]KAI5854492.1 hypothetical protein GGS23DRAFT_619745 [Durotheca rogersii]